MSRELRSFAARARAIAETAPPETVAETRTWIVDPLVSALGWEPEDVDRDAVVGDLEVDRLLSVEGIPAAFVLARPPDRSLDDGGARDLREAMGTTGVDRAIETNGRELLLYAGRGGRDRLRRDLADLSERPLEHFTAAAARRRLADEPRAAAGRRLAVRRSELAARVARSVADVAGREPGEFEAASRAFVDDLVRRRAGSGPGGATGDGADPGRAAPADEERADGPGVEAGDAGDDRPDSRADGEFVVRFFDDRGSIGAIGHGRSDRALVAGAEFLLDRGLSGVDRPLSVDGEPVLVEEPPDGAAGWRELSDGAALYAGGADADRGARLRALANRVGLRAMLTGDWADG